MANHSHDHDHDRLTPLHIEKPAPACCCGDGQACPIPSPAPAEEAPIPPAARTTAYHVEGMCCPTEEALLRQTLSDLPGVAGLRFNLLRRELTIHHDLDSTDVLETAIKRLGMRPTPLTAAGPAGQKKTKEPWWPLVLGLAAALAAEITEWLGLGSPWLSLACALAALGICGPTTYKKGFIALAHRDLNINALMSIAATGAVILGQWPEAAMVMVLFTLAERLEDASLARVRNAIHALMALAPPLATVRQADGSWRAVDVGAVPVGTAVRLRPGERVPLDGVVSLGHSSQDQSPITGESLPVEKGPGDALFAGAINLHGELEFTTTATADNSTLAHIIAVVEASPGKRANTQRFVERFARVYTPAVFAVALAVAVLPPLVLGGGWADWVYKALVLLVIACPCALVISTPVTIISGLAAAARRGILVKGGLFLEQGRDLRVVVLDKTGTVTTGKPVQTDFTALAPDAPRLRAIAASLAERTDHPVSRAVARASREDGLALLPVTEFTALSGFGVAGQVDGRRYHLVNHRRVEELGLCSPELEARLDALENQGKTTVLLADDTAVLALFGVADVVRPQSREAVADLQALGVRTIMLSGDNPHTVAAIAREAGIDEARGEQLPLDKAEAVTGLIEAAGTNRPSEKRDLVAMVGDGVNDAPALARADIGFAMGAAGTDVALETADVAIMDDDPRKIPAFIRLSRATMAILKQNIALALGLKGLVLILTFLGLGSMLLAVLADMGTSLLVIGNGLRVLRK